MSDKPYPRYQIRTELPAPHALAVFDNLYDACDAIGPLWADGKQCDVWHIEGAKPYIVPVDVVIKTQCRDRNLISLD